MDEVERIDIWRIEQPRGFAFITMGALEEAQNAIQALNGTMLGGRNLTVNEARPREAGSSGGHRSGGPQEFSRRY